MSDSQFVAHSIDADLVRRSLDGDKRAQSLLFGRSREAVHTLFRRKISDSAIAEDLTQETLLAGHQRLATLVDPERFHGWLLGIANNKLKDHYRRARHARAWQHQLVHSCAFEQSQPDTPLRALEAKVDTQLIAALMRELPWRTRQLLHCYYWRELQRPEIGEQLGIPAGTVGSRLCYARRRLRDRIVALVQ